jgi:HlyD family secretion protein
MKTSSFLFKALSVLMSAAAMYSCSTDNGRSDAYGTFEATEVIISAEVSGKLISFRCDEGMSFKNGDTIGYIDSTDWVLKKQQLLAQRKAVSSKSGNISSQAEVQKQQKENLLFEKQRLERLLKDGAATQKQMDDMKAAIELINKQIEAVETQGNSLPGELESIDKQIEQIDKNILRCKIINPIQGTVLTKYIEPNEIAVTGKALYKIADMTEMDLRIYVSGAQLSKIKIGQTVEVITDAGEKESKKNEGLVTWISPQAEFTPKIIQTKEERVNLVYACKVKVKNDGSLKIGMPGEVNFKQ